MKLVGEGIFVAPAVVFGAASWKLKEAALREPLFEEGVYFFSKV